MRHKEARNATVTSVVSDPRFNQESAVEFRSLPYGEYEICMSKKERQDRTWKTVKAPKTPDMFHRFITSIKTGKKDQPDFERGYLVQKYLDASLKSGTTNLTVKV